MPDRRRLILAVLVAAVGVALEYVLLVPFDWQQRLPGVAAAIGVAVAVLAGVLSGVLTGTIGGVVAGAVVAAAGWAFDYGFVSDRAPAWFWSLPAWLVAGALAGLCGGLLRRRSAQLRSLALRDLAIWENVADGLVRFDDRGLITAWNPGAASLYGYSEADALGRSLAELFADAEAARELLVSVGTGEGPANLRGVQRRADASEFEAALALLPTRVDPEGGFETLLVVRDVEELSRIGARAAELEASYQSLIANVPAITYRRPPDAGPRREFVTDRVYELLGYGPTEFLKDPDLFLRLVHQEDRDRLADELEATPEAGRPSRIEYRLIARNGRTVWVEDVAAVVLGEDGRPISVQGSLHDLSELRASDAEQLRLHASRLRAQEEAELRQQRIESLAEVAAAVSLASGLAARVRDVAALVTRDFAAWFVVDVFDEEGDLIRLAVERAATSRDAAGPDAEPELPALELVKGGSPQIDESRILLPLVARSGRRLGAMTLLAGAERSYHDDDVAYAHAVAGLIATAIEQERLYQEVEARADASRVLENVGEGVFLVDHEGIVRSWNPAAEAITGLRPSEIIGAKAASAIPDWSETIARISVASSHEAAPVEAVPLETESGEHWIAISAVRFLDGTVYAFHDITEAHRLDQMQAEFTATASHELRTPLAAVYGAAQTLRRHDFALDEAGRDRFIDMIVEESERLGRIVNQILLANQLDSGRVDLETEPFDASDLLHRVADATGMRTPENIEIKVADSDPDLLLTADRDMVRQILLNLIENAIKYSPDGGTIEVGAEPVGTVVRFHVLDHGIGIPADERSRIFDRFYRLDPDMTRGIGGTGLGLYICAGLVTRMGGRIWVEAGQEGGSLFLFELPQGRTHLSAPTSERKESETLVQAGARTPSA
jgi:two-component system phosphate regulon sensor histidine kinase PhoR